MKYTEKRIVQTQNELTQRHLDEVQNIYREMRGWRHDYRNHIQTMKAYLTMGRTDMLDAYLDRLHEDLSSLDLLIKSGNVMVDAILNSKLSLAVSHNIAVDAKAIVPAKMELNDVELCIIIGNLLDNAMEACLKISDENARFIRVYIDVKRSQLYISVTNSAPGRPKKLLGKYISEKAGFHGLGLSRIDRVVKKLGGWQKCSDEEGVFSAEIMIPVGN